jgi:hypothetical protein
MTNYELQYPRTQTKSNNNHHQRYNALHSGKRCFAEQSVARVCTRKCCQCGKRDLEQIVGEFGA